MINQKKVNDKDNLTLRHSIILNYIQHYISDNGYPPSIRNICQAAHLKSTSSVSYYLCDLEKMGLIHREPARSRSIRVIEKENEYKNKPKKIKGIIHVPLRNLAVSEKDFFSPDNVLEFFPLSESLLPSKDVFMAEVLDDALKGRGIFYGDKILFLKHKRCENGEINGEIAAISAEGKGMIRRIYINEKVCRLEAENDEMHPTIVRNYKIFGKAVGLWRMGI